MGDDPLSIFAVWNGGIGLWGGILGGWFAGLIYAYFAKAPIGRFMDIAAAPLLVAPNDRSNRRHHQTVSTGLVHLRCFWAWYFTDIDSTPARAVTDQYPELFGTDAERPVHPAVVYEMITNIIILGVIFLLRGRVKPAGSIFMIYLALYATARFGHPVRAIGRRQILGFARGAPNRDLCLDHHNPMDHLEGQVHRTRTAVRLAAA